MSFLLKSRKGYFCFSLFLILDSVRAIYKSINKLNTYTKKAFFASTVNLKVNESDVVREITLEFP